MGKQASEHGCDALLTHRKERFSAGGIGLLIESGLESSQAAGRRLARSRVMRRGLAAGLLLLCTAGGFASARVWDGRYPSVLSLDLARDAVADGGVREDLRKSALSQLSRFATQSMRALHDAQSDPAIAGAAEVYLRQLAKFVPEPGSLTAAYVAAGDSGLGIEKRRAALDELKRFAWNALYHLRRAAEDPLLGSYAQRYLREIREVHYDGRSGTVLQPASGRQPK